MPEDVRKIYAASAVPKTTNVYMFVLDRHGRLLHGFHALQGRRGTDSSYAEEIATALTRLDPADKAWRPPGDPQIRLPDLKPAITGLPAGVRLFLRASGRRVPVVELIPMAREDWGVLALPEQTKEIPAEALRDWLAQLYPQAIRTADQKKPYRTISGNLTLEPAGTSGELRYALLRGGVRLSKGEEESAFEGDLQAVLTYRPGSDSVHSLNAVIEGTYVYRARATREIPLLATLESRPAETPGQSAP